MKKIKYFLVAVIILSVVGVYAKSRTKEQIKIDKHLTKQLIGQWVNPYTYESTGEFKGYDFKKKGKCNIINVPSWKIEKWRVENGWIILDGYDIDEKGNKTPYHSKEKIGKISADTLELIVFEKPKTVFMYVNPKVLLKDKKKIK